MQVCPNCNSVYDESEYSKCPYCHNKDSGTIHIVYDDSIGSALNLTDVEYEEFKKRHPEYH